MSERQERVDLASWGVVAVIVVAVAGFLWLTGWWFLYGYPEYKIWEQTKAGEALLAHSQSAKEVAVSEAKAKMEAAELLAEAEIIRARGVAEANKIIGESLKDNESYLRYLWIQNLEDAGGHSSVIYVPTEAGLPILEAGRLSHVPPAEEPAP